MRQSRSYCRWVAIAGLLSCLGAMGCSRAWYRTQADEEVVDVLAEKGGYLDNGLIDPLPYSRLADIYDADCPPIPPDDPASHELMHYVDDREGSDVWHANGDAPDVDAKTWIDSLPRDENGDVVLSLNDAVQVARVNSRDYQRNLENLYLSALDVSSRRFSFDNQYALLTGTDALFSGSQRRGSSSLATGGEASVRRLTATGGQLVFGLANSIMWEFSSGQTDMLGSTFDFAITQPLLRAGGRAFVLENLTQSERRLLANVRQMEQFRRGFYINVVSGKSAGPGPGTGGNIGQGGLGLVAGQPSSSGRASGFLGLLQNQQQILNQVSNVAALRDSLAQLEATFEANRSSRLQVDQARQALLNAQTSLLVQRAGYATSVDSYKIDIGLPPDVPLRIEDQLLDRFTLIAPELSQLQDDFGPLMYQIRRQRDNPDLDTLNQAADDITSLLPRIWERLESASQDFEELRPRVPDRIAQLDKVREQVLESGADVDSRIYDNKLLQERIDYLESRLTGLREEIETNANRRKELRAAPGALALKDYRTELLENATKLSDLLLELALVQAETRLQGVTLIPLEISAKDGIEIARTSRLDWMNARANLVDSWRQIEVDANRLESDLDLVLRGDVGTRGDNPVEFDADNSAVQFGLAFDTPVTRLLERNAYRQTLIEYQQARRSYMLFEDKVKQSVRNTLRIVDLSRINFEVRRAAVQVAITQVDNARLNLNPPLKPGQLSNRTSPTAARDLVEALNGLLDAQNDFLNVWVNYEVLRMLLDFELGTMELDENGLWRDPGPVVTPN